MADLPSGASSAILVPQVVKDPIWSLQPWPLTVTFGFDEYEIPALPASAWLAILMAENIDFEEVFPGLADAEGLIEDLLEADVMDFQALADVNLDIITSVSGRPWWVALRIIFDMKQGWNAIGGELVLNGVDASRISLGAWLDAALLLILRALPEDQMTMYTLKLEMAPPGYGEDSAEISMSSDQFMSMMADQ